MKKFSYCPRCASPLAVRVREGEREDLACTGEDCGFVHYDNPTPVVAAVVETPSAEVILVRNHGWPDDWFGLVTGFLEAGEDPREAIVREVAEELGLEATVVGHIGDYVFEQMNQLIVAYHLRVSDEPFVVGGDVAQAKKVPVGKLRAWPMATGLAVRDWLGEHRGRTFSGPEGVILERGVARFAESELARLYRSVGWEGHAGDLERLRRALDGSHLVVSARDEESGALVGLLRGVSDGTWIAYLQEVLVHPDHQRRGIGRALLVAFDEVYAEVRQRVLLTDDRSDQHGFYASAGWVPLRRGTPQLHAFAKIDGLS